MDSLAGKRILFVITKANWGGAQAYVFTLAQRFQEAGADVAVALGGDGLLATRLAEAGIRTIPLPSLARDISILKEFRALGQLVQAIRAERPDVLHLNSSKAGGLGALAGRIAGVPRIVFTAHGWPHREPVGFLSWLVRVVGSWATIIFSHKVIVVSRCDYRTAPVLFSRRKLAVVHNGVEPFDTLPREEARKELAAKASGLRADVPWLLLLAELHKNKGIDTAISALAQLKAKSDADAALVVLGEGEQRAALLRHAAKLGIADRVFLFGFVPDARRYLPAADLFLMPSRKEGLPIALLEAGGVGVPAIASGVGGIPEIISNDADGLLVPPDDPTALAVSIDSLLSDTEKTRAFGTALQEKIRAEFSAKEMFVKTAAAYASSSR